jgi:hypothetical protein
VTCRSPLLAASWVIVGSPVTLEVRSFSHSQATKLGTTQTFDFSDLRLRSCHRAKTPEVLTARRAVPRLMPASDPCKKREATLPTASPRINRVFGSGSCALGFFDREAASDSVEHSHLSLLDRCNGIVDGERRLFVQQLRIVPGAFNSQIVLPLGYFQL